jgi:hypothetical protein
MKESYIERHLVRLVKAHGGLCYKFVSPGNPGVPDRIILTPTGKTIYVELKTEVGRLAKIQAWQRSEMQKRGADVRVLYGLDAVEDFIREVFGNVVHTT